MTDKTVDAVEEVAYTVEARCPKCGRDHITVFKLRHVSDSLFEAFDKFFRYATHDDADGAPCSNSAKHPNWGPK